MIDYRRDVMLVSAGAEKTCAPRTMIAGGKLLETGKKLDLGKRRWRGQVTGQA